MVLLTHPPIHHHPYDNTHTTNTLVYECIGSVIMGGDDDCHYITPHVLSGTLRQQIQIDLDLETANALQNHHGK